MMKTGENWAKSASGVQGVFGITYLFLHFGSWSQRHGLDSLKQFDIVRCDQRQSSSPPTGTSGPTHSVDVILGGRGNIVVDH